MTMTMTRPHSGVAAEVADRQREQRTADIIRRRRTEYLHLPYCRICGGATGDLSQVANSEEVACVCIQRQAELTARLRRLTTRSHQEDEIVDITEPRRAAG
jgi:hypothetical protein